MDIYETLDRLEALAKKDPDVHRKLLASREDAHPLDAFCRVCTELGFPIYPMDLIDAGEAFYAAMKRSTNGGGENSPVLADQDDFYELFFTSLKNAE